MKLTASAEQFIFTNIKKVIMEFTDGYKITIDDIKEYYIDFQKNEKSRIEIQNTIMDRELFNRFCIDDDIEYLYIEGTCVDLDENEITGVFDIPCDMRIKAIRMDGDVESATKVYVCLEGRIN